MVRSLCTILIVIAGFVGTSLPASASGMFLPSLHFFSYSGQDADSNLPYFHGRLGILRPTFDENRLYAAYRQLAGNGFTDDQARQLLATCCDIAKPYATPDITQPWLDARAAIAKDKPKLDPFRPSDQFNDTLNCFPAAFTTAATTLKARIASYGASDPAAVADWVKAQDAVFANCDGKTLTQPADAAANAPAWLKADRAYQIAAAYFYNGNYGEARQRFLAIAADSNSPWAPIAPYLAARASIRAAAAAPTPETIAQAQQDLAAAQKAGGTAVSAEDLAKLSSMLAFLTPNDRIHALEQQLLAPTLPADLDTSIHDFLSLNNVKNPPPTDLGDWIDAMENTNNTDDVIAAQKKRVLDHWQQTPTTPWLIAALAYLSPKDSQTAAAIEQSRKLDPASPGFQTAAWHRIRLEIGLGQTDIARGELDRLLADKTLTNGTRNLFLMERLQVAQHWDDFAKFAPRQPEFVGPYWDDSNADGDGYFTLPLKPKAKGYGPYLGWRSELFTAEPRYLDVDSAYLLSTAAPLATLAKLALDPALSTNIRSDIALATFTRTVLLGNIEIGEQMATALEKDFPQYDTDWQRYLNAQQADERNFAAAILLLRLPGAAPWVEDNLGYNYQADVIGAFAQRWWATDSMKNEFDLAAQYYTTPCTDACPMPGWLGPTIFVSAADQATATKEIAQIRKDASAADYLGTIVVAWAQAHADDPRVPEALHLVVRVTQYGDPGNGISQRAYTVLHKSYPDSPWTKQTPHWYSDKSN